MHKVTVNAPIAVCEGMAIHKSKSEHRGGNYRVETLRWTAIEGDHTCNQGFQIVCARADVVRNGRSRISVVLSDEPPGFPQSKLNESGISDHQALKADQFLYVDPVAPGIPYGLTPAQNSVVGRA